MIKYGLPAIAALILGFAVLHIVRTQPVRPEWRRHRASYRDSQKMWRGGLVEASSENIGISVPVPGWSRMFTSRPRPSDKGQKLFSIDDAICSGVESAEKLARTLPAALDKLLRSRVPRRSARRSRGERSR